MRPLPAISGYAFPLVLYMFFQAVFQSCWAATLFCTVSSEIGLYLILLFCH